jgi:hypothetical protein
LGASVSDSAAMTFDKLIRNGKQNSKEAVELLRTVEKQWQLDKDNQSVEEDLKANPIRRVFCGLSIFQGSGQLSHE